MEGALVILRANLGFFGGDIPEDLENYLRHLIGQAVQRLREDSNVLLDLRKLPDQMLAAEYAAWMYRKRVEGPRLSPSLLASIRHRQLRQAAGGAADDL